MAKRRRYPRNPIPAAERPPSRLEGRIWQHLCELDRRMESSRIWLPLLSLVMASGLMLVAAAFRISVAGPAKPDGLYWVGLLLMVVPTAARLATLSASRGERLALVVLLGIGFYAVKVMHSPDAFTYADELVHYANAGQVLRTQQLFGENSILRVTPSFPGLPTVTTALANLSGLSIFTSGLLVIGAARLVITLGLFLIYERLSGSDRLAGLGAVIYMANSNYLYWSAQYAYESLALPLAVFVVFALVLHQIPGSQRTPQPATLVAVAGVLAVTVTHHLTSFALVGLLGSLALFTMVLGRADRPAKLSLWGLTLLALGAVLFWNLMVAGYTYDYLFPVLKKAVTAGLSLVTGGGEESGRALFESNASAVVTPLWERVVGIASVLLILAATPIGVWHFWRRLRMAPLQSNASGQAELGVRSMEFSPQSYRIELYGDRQLLLHFDDIQLDPKQAWAVRLDLNDLMPESAPLEAYLYRTDQPGAPYRQVRLWPEGISLSANQEGQGIQTIP